MSHLRRSLTASMTLALVAATLSINAVAAATPLMPDLGMARLRKFSIDTTSQPGQTRLRFTTVIVNIGDGPFQAYGHDPLNGELSVDGQIQNSDGTWTSYPAPAYHMYFAGDGHMHWHLRDLEKYVLRDTTTGIKGVGAKAGFCFFDNTTFNLALPGAPQAPVYTKCKGPLGPLDTAVTVGLSIGWGDKYPATIPDQYIDISGLPDGQYSLTATADALNGFTERCEGNNSTTAVLQITGSSVTVVTAGKPSKRCP